MDPFYGILVWRKALGRLSKAGRNCFRFHLQSVRREFRCAKVLLSIPWGYKGNAKQMQRGFQRNPKEIQIGNTRNTKQIQGEYAGNAKGTKAKYLKHCDLEARFWNETPTLAQQEAALLVDPTEGPK